jgi:hypothetical protein
MMANDAQRAADVINGNPMKDVALETLKAALHFTKALLILKLIILRLSGTT